MEVKAQIFAKNMDVSDRVEEYITKKTARLGKFLSDIEDNRIDIAYIKSARSAADRYVAQITIRGKGYILRTEERADDLFTAFDTSLDKMIRQIERFKGKRSRTRIEKVEIPAVESVAEEDDDQPVIVRRKKFDLVPMNEAEALDQMQLLGHEEFFIFFNGETSAVNVLYKRNDGTYGLIETEIA